MIQMAMFFKLLADYKQLWAGIGSMYQDEGAQAGKIRAEHLSVVMRLTPYAMAANVGSASLVLWALHSQLRISANVTDHFGAS